MVNITITMSKDDYEYIIGELNAARQNTYIQHTSDALSKDEIVDKTNMANSHIQHILAKLS